MELKVGTRWQSTRCTTQVIIVRAPEGSHSLDCGGAPMRPLAPGEIADPTGSPVEPFADGTAMGKRYRDEERGIEVLCTKPGNGSLALDGGAIPAAEAKPLPASD